ncbi:hypothetical protein ECIAI1_2113 [Escherichia coli IAI1]|nr:hypothetical protein ECIAI1_2113 [Escherichia coli IAI1]
MYERQLNIEISFQLSFGILFQNNIIAKAKGKIKIANRFDVKLNSEAYNR